MRKDFESMFMPNVKFKISSEDLNNPLLRETIINQGINSIYPVGFLVSQDGQSFTSVCSQVWWERLENIEVSVYEAFPKCIPDGMRYNKELNKLVPDVIEDCFNSDFVQESADTLNRSAIYLKKEIINKRENGFIKADLQKLDFSLVDPFAYSDLAFQLTVGAKKYSKDNWKKGDINIYLSALERHIQAIKIALDNDDIESLIDDTGIQHGGALLCNSMFIHYFIRQILKDKNVK